MYNRSISSMCEIIAVTISPQKAKDWRAIMISKLRAHFGEHIDLAKVRVGLTWNKELQWWTWNICASDTCPGKSKGCDNCYACKGNFTFTSVELAHLFRALATLDPFAFIESMDQEVKRRRKLSLRKAGRAKPFDVLRVHSAGDFYSIDYIYCWYEIAKRNPSIHFLAYTRSWRVPEFRHALTRISRLPNFTVRYSTDQTIKDNDWIKGKLQAHMGTYAGPANCSKQLIPGASCRTCGQCLSGTNQQTGRPYDTLKTVRFIEH